MKKMDQAAKAFSERDKSCHNLAQYDQAYAEYEQHNEKLHHQLVIFKEMLSKQKQSEELYEYSSTPSLVSHLGEDSTLNPGLILKEPKGRFGTKIH